MRIAHYRDLMTYDVGNGFYVDIVLDRESKYHTYEAWLFNHDYGQKMLMFGMPEKQQTLMEFIETVMANLPEHIDYYKEDVFD